MVCLAAFFPFAGALAAVALFFPFSGAGASWATRAPTVAFPVAWGLLRGAGAAGWGADFTFTICPSLAIRCQILPAARLGSWRLLSGCVGRSGRAVGEHKNTERVASTEGIIGYPLSRAKSASYERQALK
jgi:hypothetical protein